MNDISIPTDDDLIIQKSPASRLREVDYGKLTFGTKFSDHMLICDWEGGKWGKSYIKPFGNLEVTPALHALHYAQAIFEGQKAYYMKDGRIGIFRLEENGKRLNASAERMLMPQYKLERFVEDIVKMVDLDREWVPRGEGQALYLRPFMFGSSEFVAARPSEKYTFCTIMSPVAAYYPGSVKVRVEETHTRSATGGVGFTKAAGNYGAAFYPTHLAKRDGYTQVIWTDHQNHELIEESGTMNVAFIIDDTFITPPLSDRILPGITRDSILTLLKDNKLLKVEERPIKVEEVIGAAREGRLQECFGMGTAAVVSQIDTIGFRGEDFKIPDPQDGYAMQIKKDLTAIRMGEVEDKFGWMTIV